MGKGYMAKRILAGLGLLGVIMVLPVCAANNPPNLENTRLFTKLAADCQDVDMTTWQHPTRKVLTNAGSEILQVKLCNNKKYPVFFLKLKYAPGPEAQTQDYYGSLYQQMRRANGRMPYSIVSVQDNATLNISYGAQGQVEIDYERYKS